MEKTKLQKIREHHEKFRARVEELGEQLRNLKLPVLTEEMFSLYEKTGNRLIYENEYFERRRFLVVYGLLSSWYKRTEDIEKLEYVIAEICQETTWALPAHVDRNVPGWERTVDLFSSETGQTLANILYLNKDVLSKELYDSTKELVVDRLLDSYMEVPRGQWRWEVMYNNWVSVCASCIGSAALFLLDDDKEKQEKIISRVCDTLPDYLAGMLDDGTCPEGMSYYTYGMVFYTGFARQLKEATGGKVDLLDSEKVRNIARFQNICYLPNGNTVSFSDGERKDRYRLGLTCYFAMTVNGAKIPDISAAMEFDTDHCYRFMGNWQDDVWVREYLATAKEDDVEEDNETFYFLPDAQWAVWNKERIGIAFKGGNNDEPHNHNDIGSFLFTADGEVFLADLGCGEYTKDYFNPDTRYQILCNRSLGHSVPIVNEREQGQGKDHCCEYFKCLKEGMVELSFSNAYEAGADWKLVRRLESAEDDENLLITDTISGDGVTKFEENLVTQIKPLITGNQVILNGEHGTMLLELPNECSDIRLIEETFHNHRGKEEDVWMIRFSIPLTDSKGCCQMLCRYVAKPSNEDTVE